MKTAQILAVILLIFLLAIILKLPITSNVHALTTHIVISQIQVGGTGNAHQEFVELYNPTENSVDLSSWKLSKKASSSASFTNLIPNLSGSVEPHKYFLMASSEFTSTVSADLTYIASGSSTISTNNTIAIFDSSNNLIDKVGMGLAQDKETSDAPEPSNNHSIIRKASSSSTVADLLPGGIEGNAGNGFDSDNNLNDFVVFNVAMPRNSSSPAAPPLPTITPSITPSPLLTETPTVIPLDTPTPTQITPTDTPFPTETLTPTPLDTPTPSDTPSPIPTEISTPTPTNTPMPTITLTPTQTPTEVPTETPFLTLTPTSIPTKTPTPTPVLTITPTITPTPSIILREIHLPNGTLTCIWSGKTITIFGLKIIIPSVRCSFEKI